MLDERGLKCEGRADAIEFGFQRAASAALVAHTRPIMLVHTVKTNLLYFRLWQTLQISVNGVTWPGACVYTKYVNTIKAGRLLIKSREARYLNR